MRAGLLLLLAAIAIYLPQLGFEEWRGTEARRVQIAMEMAQNGEWMVPVLGAEPIFTKPPLYYQVLRLALLAGDAKWWLRTPSVLAFVALALVVFGMLRRTRGERAAWLGAIGTLLCPSALHHVPNAEIDPLFAALTGISLVLLAEGVAYGQRGRVAIAGLVGGLAFLAKGAPYFLFLAGILLIWLRRWRLRGIGWFALPFVVLPALYYVPLLTVWADAGEVIEIVRDEHLQHVEGSLLRRIVRTPEYMLRVLAVLMPVGLWTFHEYRGSVEVREVNVKPEEAVLRLCAGAALAALALMTFAGHRAARYILPAAPLFVAAVAPAASAYALHRAPLTPGLAGVLRAFGVAGAVALLAAPWMPVPFPWRTPALALLLCVGALVVRERAQMVVFTMIVAPLVAAWTLLPDWDAYASDRHRPAAAILEREIDARAAAEIETRGHVPSQLFVEWGRFPSGDELRQRSPRARWLLDEDTFEDEFDDNDEERSTYGYEDRVRLRLQGKTVVLEERR